MKYKYCIGAKQNWSIYFFLFCFFFHFELNLIPITQNYFVTLFVCLILELKCDAMQCDTFDSLKSEVTFFFFVLEIKEADRYGWRKEYKTFIIYCVF